MGLLLKKISKYYEQTICYLCVFIVAPVIFFLEMAIVRPTVIEILELGVAEQYLHLICPTFCFINVTGNMFMSIFTDTRLKSSHSDGTYCEQCNLYRPAGSWHCTTCNACILRRDHHCVFLSRCIGLHNQRYYVSFLGYLSISLTYTLYYNYYFVSSLLDGYGLLISMMRLLNPVLRYLGLETASMKDFCSVLLVMNAILLFWSFPSFLFHISNVFKGVTTRESKSVCLLCLEWPKWKENMMQVYGQRWFWTMLCPFVPIIPPPCVKAE